MLPITIDIYTNIERKKVINKWQKQSTSQAQDIEEFYNNMNDEMDKLAKAKLSDFFDNNYDTILAKKLKEAYLYEEYIKPQLGETIGIIRIDKINVDIPIIEGINAEYLKLGAGHFAETDLPGEIGNCVLAGHRSYTYGKLFNRLGEIKEGDIFQIDFRGETFEYKVYKIHIIEPSDFSVLNRNNSDKILTLITCHPPRVNTHRLVIHALQV